MSEQLSLHDEDGWGHSERQSLEEKRQIRQLLASHPIGQEALLRAGILKLNEDPHPPEDMRDLRS